MSGARTWSGRFVSLHGTSPTIDAGEHRPSELLAKLNEASAREKRLRPWRNTFRLLARIVFVVTVLKVWL